MLVVSEFQEIYTKYLEQFFVEDIKWVYSGTVLTLSYVDMSMPVRIRWRVRHGYVLTETKEYLSY